MLAPAGVDQAKDTVIPAVKQTIERTAAHTTTFRKLLNTRIAERAGNTIRLEIIIAPIRRIPTTTVRAVRTATSALYADERIPLAVAKDSSNVTKKIRLYNRTNRLITTAPKITLIITSVLLMARMLPNIKAVTSVFRPLVTDVTIIPIASALLEIRAIAASPFTPEEEALTRRSRNAARMHTGTETASGAQLNAIATAIVPNPTWLSPSPIIEKRFSTSTIPRSDAHSEISVPAIKARMINPYEKSALKKSIIVVFSGNVDVACSAIISAVAKMRFADFYVAHCFVERCFLIVRRSSEEYRRFIQMENVRCILHGAADIVAYHKDGNLVFLIKFSDD